VAVFCTLSRVCIILGKGDGVMALGGMDVDECMTMDVFYFSLLFALKEVERVLSFLGYAYAHHRLRVCFKEACVGGFSFVAFRRGSGCAGLGFALGCW
jgi:hypothetical protein